MSFDSLQLYLLFHCISIIIYSSIEDVDEVIKAGTLSVGSSIMGASKVAP